MKSYEDFFEQMRGVMAEEYEVSPEKITSEAQLVATLDLDSLDMVDVVALVDNKLGIVLRAEDFQGVQTFGDFFHMLYGKLEQQEASRHR